MSQDCKGCFTSTPLTQLASGYCDDCRRNLAETLNAITIGNVGFFEQLAEADARRKQNGVEIRGTCEQD